jgi:hypothetical protein
MKMIKRLVVIMCCLMMLGAQEYSVPTGYIFLPNNEITPAISLIAKKLLVNDFGTEIPFQIDKQQYLARVEHHYHPPPPPNSPPEVQKRYPKPWGVHKGITIYKKL